MSLPVARIGVYVLLSIFAVAAVAGGLALRRRTDPVADCELARWGASAG
jgi:hypothetical protein